MYKVAKNLFYEESKEKYIIDDLSKEEKNKVLAFLKDDNLCKIADKNFVICPIWLLPVGTKLKDPRKKRSYKFGDQVFYWENWYIELFEKGKIHIAKHMIDYILNEYANGNYPKK